jgi:hypothetical protein
MRDIPAVRCDRSSRWERQSPVKINTERSFTALRASVRHASHSHLTLKHGFYAITVMPRNRCSSLSCSAEILKAFSTLSGSPE